MNARILFVAIVAGFLAGAFVSVVLMFKVTHLILAAEAYEVGGAGERFRLSLSPHGGLMAKTRRPAATPHRNANDSH